LITKEIDTRLAPFDTKNSEQSCALSTVDYVALFLPVILFSSSRGLIDVIIFVLLLGFSIDPRLLPDGPSNDKSCAPYGVNKVGNETAS
ncbi:hypothetical protein JCM5350_005182, partial [Sporobolomyces pararoseus]